MASAISRREAQQRHARLDHGDPEAQLYRKGRGKEAKLSFMGHTLMENRSGLIVAATLTQATGTSETKGCRRDDRAPLARGSAHHLGRRQGLRRSGIRRRHACTQRDATYRTEHQRTTFRGRRQYHGISAMR
jgi:hypothetical protein